MSEKPALYWLNQNVVLLPVRSKVLSTYSPPPEYLPKLSKPMQPIPSVSTTPTSQLGDSELDAQR